MIDIINFTELRRISVEGGDVLHGLKKKELGYVGFGELYFSSIYWQRYKCWKRHRRMTMNLIVPIGMVAFVFAEKTADDTYRYRREEIGDRRYGRLTVPPNIWFGFQGLTEGVSLIANVSDIEHDEDEVERVPYNQIPYVWH